MNTIPDNFEDFLYWVKETTEKRWANFAESKKDGNWWYHKHDLLEGAKWIDPLSDEEIDALEIKWNIKFPSDHRTFLKILHRVDKDNFFEQSDPDPEVNEIELKRAPLFHNWRDDELIKDRFEYPFEYIRHDVFESQQPAWLKSWGAKPSTEKECHAIVEEWIEKANILIPINAHRFLISEPTSQCNHVISIYGFDTILYSLDLREHLINELRWDLGLDEREYDDEEGKPTPLAVANAIKSIQDETFEDENSVSNEEQYENWLLERRKVYQTIPYWEEVILYYSSGWGSIGLKFPYENYSRAQPIVVADDATIQKQFEA